MKNILQNCFFAATPIPFDSKGNIMPEVQKKYAQWMADKAITGVALWVHTGRGLFLTPEQRAEVFHTWRAALPAEKNIICGVGCSNKPEYSDEEYIAKAVEMCKHAKALGADAVLAFAPLKFRGRPDQDEMILKYHNALAEVGIDMVLFYLYEAGGGISYSLEILEKLFAIEQVKGIKMATLDGVTTVQYVSQLVEKTPGISLITGEDRMYGYSFARGCSGALVGLGAVCQQLQWDMMESFRQKDYKGFVIGMLNVDKLAECTFINPMEGYIQKMLYILFLQGVIPEEAVHDPWGPGLTEPEKARIITVLKELGEL